MAKYPNHLYTVVIDFGPAIPAFQQHFVDPIKAAKIFSLLKDRANKTDGQCIERLTVWHKDKMVSSHTPKPPPVVWLPPPDEDGVRRIPEHGKRPRRLPSTIPTTDITGVVL